MIFNVARARIVARVPLWTPYRQLNKYPVILSSHFSTRASQKNDSGPLSDGKTGITHFKNSDKPPKDITQTEGTFGDEWTLPNPIWSKEERDGIEKSHVPVSGVVDRLAYGSVFIMRRSFDLLSGFTIGKRFESLDEKAVLKRIIYLETVAGVPPMMAAMVRHLQSLRLMRMDGGWIHTLLEEAENERMHLMIALSLRKPGKLLSFAVLGTQLIFCNAYFIAYLISPRFCHRFVGYLEEEAVMTYSFILELVRDDKLPMFTSLPAPKIAVEYYHLPDGSMMADVIACIRADEAHHRDVNHTFATLETTEKNPISRFHEKKD